MIELRTYDTIRGFTASEWDALAGEGAPPFVRFEWLDALESTGCVRPERGWLPMHISLKKDDQLIAVAPAYVKGNSEGEFVFDHSWARFCEARLNVEYYPKLIVAAPFTPATGPRLLVSESADRAEAMSAFARGLEQIIEKAGLSSAHVLFPREREARELQDAGLAHRCGLQYHWKNPGYADFDDFLSRFSSKRRNQIKRERRSLGEQGTEIEVLTGADIVEEAVDAMYEFYFSTVQKYYWGRQYLNRGFFHEICTRMPESIQIVLARDAASKKPVGGAFNLLGGSRLFGRYWGCSEERPNLHFNVCFYEGISECIRLGIDTFEPGAGGEHKLARGFEPTITHSAHVLAHPTLDRAVRSFVDEEALAIRQHVACETSVLKPREAPAPPK